MPHMSYVSPKSLQGPFKKASFSLEIQVVASHFTDEKHLMEPSLWLFWGRNPLSYRFSCFWAATASHSTWICWKKTFQFKNLKPKTKNHQSKNILKKIRKAKPRPTTFTTPLAPTCSRSSGVGPPPPPPPARPGRPTKGSEEGSCWWGGEGVLRCKPWKNREKQGKPMEKPMENTKSSHFVLIKWEKKTRRFGYLPKGTWFLGQAIFKWRPEARRKRMPLSFEGSF